MNIAEVIGTLERRGLRVSQAQLESDVHDHYLPAPETIAIGGGGRQGAWSAPTVARATYLYSLRTRGVTGQRLRLLLFLFDGWGWQYVRETVITALKKNAEANKSGLRQAVRKRTPENVSGSLDDIMEAQDRRLRPRSQQRDDETPFTYDQPMAAFALGMGLFGEPLAQGSMAALTPLMQQMTPNWDYGTTVAARLLTEQITIDSKMTWDKVVELLARMDDTTASNALPSVKTFLRDLRSMVHRESMKEHPRPKSNPITLFGHWTASVDDGFWKDIPERFTPAQLLAGFLGILMASDVLLESSVAGQMLNIMQALSEPTENNTTAQ